MQENKLNDNPQDASVKKNSVEVLKKFKQASTVKEKLELFRDEDRLVYEERKESIKIQHDQGKLTTYERIIKLTDPNSFEELDKWHRPYETGFNIGEESGWGDGVVIGYGTLDGIPITLWAQDATVMAGTIGTVQARKICMIIENAINAKTPIISIFDSAGIRAQDAIQYPDFYSTGAIARFQTQASGIVPKISLVMGPCTGDLALIASLGDFLFMVRNSSFMHLIPIYPETNSSESGDAWNVHAKLTGCCDVIADNDEDCLQRCKKLLSYLPSNSTQKPPVVHLGDDPNRKEEELLELVPIDSSKPFSMYKLISLVVDKGEIFEIRRFWARNLITAFARLDGNTVGIIANNPEDKGGCMTLDAADKMTHFVRFCDAFNIPCIWLADTPAFLPAVEEETRGLIRHGSGMIYANTEATVPKITVFIRKAYGGGRLAMPGQFLMGDLQIAWPTYEPGLMGAEGAVAIIYRSELQSIKDEQARNQQKNKRIEEMQFGLDMLLRESTQKFIDPRDTRPFLIKALKWLKDKQVSSPSKKHENIRL